MAERRMFARSIIGSARFLKMPATSRLLYYDLGMDADDDGVVEAFGVIRKTGATEDDLRVLVSKDFVKVLNEDLLSHITDWKQNNFIRPDRYKPSVHKELLLRLCDGIPNDNQMTTNGIPMVDGWYTQDRIGEERIEQDSVNEDQKADKPPKRTRFIPPTVDEVRTYCQENGYQIDPEYFVDYYTANNWMAGKNKMKDWKATVRNWNRREVEKQPTAKRSETPDFWKVPVI